MSQGSASLVTVSKLHVEIQVTGASQTHGYCMHQKIKPCILTDFSDKLDQIGSQVAIPLQARYPVMHVRRQLRQCRTQCRPMHGIA